MKAKIESVLTDEQREKFDVLAEGETRREKIWSECVFKAKGLIKKYDDVRMEIAELAMKACSDAETKGLKFKFTVSRFAREIGIGETTLRDWVDARRVLIRLPPEKRQYNLQFYRDAAKIVLDTDKSEQVERKFNRIVRQKSSRNAKFVAYAGNLKSLLKLAQNAKEVEAADSDTLEEILHLCAQIQHFIDLTKNNRKKNAG